MRGRDAALVAMVVLGSAIQGHAARGTGPGGYTWKDCLEVDGPPCAYATTAVSDARTGLCSDEVYDDPRDDLGFAFYFFGATYRNYAVSANGVLYLANAPPCCDDANAALDGMEGAPFIAVLWDDWAMDNADDFDFPCGVNPDCSNTGPWTRVESFQRGAGSDAGVLFRDFEWFSTAHHGPPCTEDTVEQATFALRLYEDGRILMSYLDTSLGLATVDHGASATIGVSGGFAGQFTQVSFDTASIPANPHAILFEPPPCPPLACAGVAVAPDPGCQGVAQQLTADVTGGQPPVTVTWDLNGDTVVDATGNPVVRALGPGTWSVTATARDSCTRPAAQSCSSFTTATVLPTPSPSITPSGTTSFCARDGGSVRLDASFGFASYRWKLDGLEVVGATAPAHVVAESGSWTVEVVDADGCVGESRAVIVDAAACAPCADFACAVVVSPSMPVQGSPVALELVPAAGVAPFLVDWDLDGDTVVDTSGNPVMVMLPCGSWDVAGSAVDSCLPTAGTCAASSAFTVAPSASLPELSPPGGIPLRVIGGGDSVVVPSGAVAYNVHADAIGTWRSPGPATGGACHVVAWTDNGDGTVTLDHALGADTWIVVTVSDDCGEGPAGRDSLGAERSDAAAWVRCGPLP